MTEVLSAFRVVQVGVESTYGIAVAATKRLQTIKLMPTPDVTSLPFTPSGDLLPTIAPVSRELTNCRLDMQPSFGEIIYPLSSMFGAATITTPGSGFNARQWLWTWVPTTAITPVSYTLEYGDSVEAEQVPGLVASGISISADRQRIQGSGTMFGQQMNQAFTLTSLSGTSDQQTVSISGTPTGGTFTLTLNGQPTAAIVYNAAGSAVASAVAALSNVGTGNVTATGGPLPGTPVVLTFAAGLANQPVNVMTAASGSLTGGSTPTVSVAHTTPGVSITPEPTAVPIMPNQIDLWMDASAGTIGTTQMLRGFNATLSITDMLQQAWALNSSLNSFAAANPNPPRATFQLTLAQDATGRSLLTALRAGSRKYIRMKATGPVIEGTIHYGATFDMALNVVSVGDMQEVGGIYARQATLQFMDDTTMPTTITVVNAVRSLS